MGGKISHEKFIQVSKEKHGDLYDYTNTVYVSELGQYQQVSIHCKVHGGFSIQAANHMQGRGCQQCSFDRRAAGKRMSLEEWKQRCTEKHNGKYNYDRCNSYDNQKTAMEILCPVHGYYTTSANNHIHGKGCKKCGFSKSSEKQIDSKEDCIRKFKEVHGSRYSYNLPNEFKGDRSKIDILCPDHGVFNMSIGGHKVGAGCPDCAKLSKSKRFSLGLEKWKQECSELHNNKYDYSLCTDYETQNSRMNIICPDHGVFNQSAAAHRIGQGCPACAKTGFDQNKQAHIYILVGENSVVKLGITNREPIERCKQIVKDSKKQFSIYSSFCLELGSTAYQIEQQLLKALRELYKQPEEPFAGSTECFIDLPPSLLQQLIENKIQQHGYKPIDKTVSQ